MLDGRGEGGDVRRGANGIAQQGTGRSEPARFSTRNVLKSADTIAIAYGQRSQLEPQDFGGVAFAEVRTLRVDGMKRKA